MSRPQHRLATFALFGTLGLALLWLWSALHDARPVPLRSASGGERHADRRRSAPLRRVTPTSKAERAAPTAPHSFGSASGAVRAQASGDRVREQLGLPPVLSDLAQAHSFRPPTPAEKHNPTLGQLYATDRGRHQQRWLARQARVEAMRFQREAARERDPTRRAVLERSAHAHRRRARRHLARWRELGRQRARLISSARREDNP